MAIKRAVILDTDWIIFKAMSGAEMEIQWDDDVWTLECDHNVAWKALHSHVNSLLSQVQDQHPDDLLIPVMCYTDKHNWRKDILATYKANRIGKRKPTGYLHFLERVKSEEGFKHFQRPSLEGDDCMGIIGSRPQIVGCDVATIVSCDKDFKTIPCEFYHQSVNPQFAPNTWYNNDLDAANYWHMYQTLIGDTADGYTGVAGMGEKTAIEFLDSPYIWESYEHEFKSGARKGMTEQRWRKREPTLDETLWNCIVSVGAKAGQSESDILVQAQVARICRSDDFNPKTGEVILWTPDKL